jgi:hypothetical protein
MYEMCKMRDVSVDAGHSSQHPASVSNVAEGKLEKESRKKREIAAKRRERLMSQIARMQRNFIRENRELLEKIPSDASFTSMDDSRSAFVIQLYCFNEPASSSSDQQKYKKR